MLLTGKIPSNTFNILKINKEINKIYPQYIKKEREGETGGLSLLCKSGFGLFLP